MSSSISVVALAGGVGGAKLAHGLAQVLRPEQLTIVVNTGDDFEHLGLSISPDLDTVLYALAGVANPDTGWGRADEGWRFMESVRAFGGPDWFNLGDRDLATHVLRTQRLRAGETLTEVTRGLAAALGIKPALLPMSDDPVRTRVDTEVGELAFQDYFVAQRCAPRARAIRFAGAEAARPSAAVRDALARADLIVICPSNPFLSIGPILTVNGIRDAVQARPTIAVSPIVGGRALKGPAAKLLGELGHDVSALGIARAYVGLVDMLLIDTLDAALAPEIEALGLRAIVAESVMRTDADRAALARRVLASAGV
ncbi:MAG TPA: 2-phospho-L-lactate transferase [Anaerolineales bacterium]|nr:2-phospho-L-lactate transferase [Anaerolineales bacterium]